MTGPPRSTRTVRARPRRPICGRGSAARGWHHGRSGGITSRRDKRRVRRGGSDHHRVRGDPGHRVLPHAERHDEVLLPAIYPNLEGGFRPQLRPDRHGDPGVSDDRLPAAAPGGPLRRQAPHPARPARRNPVHSGGTDRPVHGPRLSRAAGRRLPDRNGLLDLPPGVLASGAHGLRRAPRPGAVHVPGGRQHRSGAGTAGRRRGGGALGPVRAWRSSR